MHHGRGREGEKQSEKVLAKLANRVGQEIHTGVSVRYSFVLVKPVNYSFGKKRNLKIFCLMFQEKNNADFKTASFPFLQGKCLRLFKIGLL